MKHRSERKAKVPKKVARKKAVKTKVFPGFKVELLAATNSEKPLVDMSGSAIAARQAVGAGPNPNYEAPGRGEIVGGEMAKLTEEIALLARKKGGKDEIQNKLMMATATAAYEGERKADQRHMQNVKDIHEAHTDKVVCGLISEAESVMRERHGLPPDEPWVISSYMLARIIDALNRAGYTAKGKR